MLPRINQGPYPTLKITRPERSVPGGASPYLDWWCVVEESSGEVFARSDVGRLDDASASTQLRCLIIDDSTIDRQLMARLVRRGPSPVTIVEADTVKSALEALWQGNFDIVLLDNDLPDGTGIETTTSLCDNFGTRMPPVIMVSGNTSPELPAQAHAAGCCDFLSKDDLTAATLVDAIDRAVRSDVHISLAEGPHEVLVIASRIERSLAALISDAPLPPAMHQSLLSDSRGLRRLLEQAFAKDEARLQ